MPKTILAIETSCDETSVAVLKGTEILSNVVHSQLDLHKEYGGVVPNLARLEHEKKFDSVLNNALNEAEVALEQIELVAVTVGPGLAIALEVGLQKAKEIAKKLAIPLAPTNHMEGHLFSSLADSKNKLEFPSLGVLVSGGHSEIILVSGVGEYEKIGQTLDDAAGEAFDKVSVMLGLGYPGGPLISKYAAESKHEIFHVKRNQSSYVAIQGNEELELPIPMLNSGDLNMSYSGLKTAVKQLVNSLSGNTDLQNIRSTAESSELSEEQVQDICLLFQTAAIQMLIIKLEKAIKGYPEMKQLLVGGGVIANSYLREQLQLLANTHNLKLLLPPKGLTGDNAGMIGLAAALRDEAGILKVYSANEFAQIDRKPRWSISDIG